MSGEPTHPQASAAAEALDGIDHVLAQKPQKDDETLTVVIKQLCIYRDQLIARNARPGRTGEDRRRLTHANAILTAVLAVQFPLGEIPWDELAKSRDWLQGLMAEAV